jgi:hypothetical protein
MIAKLSAGTAVYNTPFPDADEIKTAPGRDPMRRRK